MIEIQCSECKAFIARYTGSGKLGLLFIDTIIKPDSLADLNSLSKTELPLLVCQECGCELGKPTSNKEGRIAYKMIKGSFRKKGIIKAMTPSPHTSWR